MEKRMIEDVKLKTLAGLPYKLEDVTIYPVKLIDIAELGSDKYFNYLNVLALDVNDLQGNDLQANELELTNFMLFALRCAENKEMKDTVKDLFKFFFKVNDYIFNDQNLEFILDNGSVINNSNFEGIKKIVFLQNGINLDKKKKKDVKPQNDKAAEIAEKIKKSKEKINKSKNNADVDLNYHDLVSAYCAYDKSVNIFDVWQMNVYQFNDQFRRLRMIEEHDISIQSLMHGAKKEKIKVKNWICKIND